MVHDVSFFLEAQCAADQHAGEQLLRILCSGYPAGQESVTGSLSSLGKSESAHVSIIQYNVSTFFSCICSTDVFLHREAYRDFDP